MIKNSTILLSVFLLGALTLASCGKSEPDLSKFAESCNKVAKCDPQLSAIPEPQKSCQKLLAQIEARLPDAIAPIQECIKNTACEELSLQACGSEHLQGMKAFMP